MKCPYCKSDESWAMLRPKWMRRIAFLRNRRCSSCGVEYAQWMRIIPIKHQVALFLSRLWLLVLVAAAMIGAGVGIGALLCWRASLP